MLQSPLPLGLPYHLGPSLILSLIGPMLRHRLR
ncbi:hypothetical protein AXYL_05704 [Achromobacter xylosoxidans A8]|uniref:Uncharacterized protein n=1 Tax=Achromobacter xylosoxidans (strain A8) TaxID=762376 RepID=E3HGA0_ACHXA|nr:hypothetical protein AXYL_05704 [Achromobacter xylosoxidans A8]